MRLLARAAARIGRFLRALAALAALGALLVGVPWGLVHYIGWPLPDHVPTGDEIEATLLNPLSVTLLLDILACIAWPTWLVFALDVARCVPDALRGVRPPALGPIHAIASVLVAATVLGLLQPRSPTATAAGLTVHSTPTAVVGQTFVIPTPDEHMNRDRVRPEQVAAAAQDGTVVVEPPHAGIHDSLWRIAERALGSGDRWPELFALNRSHPQPDGDALTDPHLIRPGWVLRLPDHAPQQPAPPPISQPQPPVQQPPPPQQPTPAPPTTPHNAPEAAPDRHPAPGSPNAPVSTTPGTAITLWSGGLVAAGLAAAVAFAMLIRRRRRLRSYQPGSGDRTPPPAPAPAVHALRLAYDQDHLDPDLDEEERIPFVTLTSEDRAGSPAEPAEPTASAVADDRPAAIEVGVREERTRALDLASVHGLGLTGAGAEATARSLLVHLLATTRATLVVPEDDARALLGAEPPDSPRLSITADLNAAISDLANRCGSAETQREAENPPLDAVLVARVDQPNARLQSVLDSGTSRGVAGILLGHWPAGATVRVRGDGIVTAASPSIDDLCGSRLFHLDATDTRDLVDLLADTAHAATSLGPEVDDEHEPAAPEEPDGHPSAEPVAEVDNQLPDSEIQTADFVQPFREEDDSVEPAPEADNEVQEPPTVTIRGDLRAGEQTATEPSSVAQLVEVPEGTREQPERPVTLAVFGPVTLTWHTPDGADQDLTGALAPKHKALLVFLALHPKGTTRGAVREALWPVARGRRPFNAFYASLSQIRKALAHATDDHVVELVDQHDEQVALNNDLVEVDYWELDNAEHDRHIATTDEQRLAAWSRIAAVYRGEIAEGMSALWLDGPREAAHRAVVDALAGMAAHYRGRDPQRQLQLLEHARLLNPENEAIYRDIMRVQAELGLADAISRTVQLLTTTLADIGERPDPSTLTLARALQARHRRIAS